jgi:ElaA protein
VDADLRLRLVPGPDLIAADLYRLLRLRAAVFVVEQDCPYLDPDGRDLDPGTTHLWLDAPDDTVAACVRVLTEPAGGTRLGRVVTAPTHRGRRLSARLIDEALRFAVRPVVLDAQSHLADVYARHGFVVDGPDFVEDDILHTPMRLD